MGYIEALTDGRREFLAFKLMVLLHQWRRVFSGLLQIGCLDMTDIAIKTYDQGVTKDP